MASPRLNQWLDVIAEACCRQSEDKIPPGFHSVIEIAKASGSTKNTASKTLLAGLKLGIVERVMLKRFRNNQLRKIGYYRFKQ
jgi:hypothetical protein